MKTFIILLCVLPLIISHVFSMPNAASELIRDNEAQLALKDSSVAAVPTCSTGFAIIGSNCYLVGTAQITWDDANSMCKSVNADLAHIADYDENKLLVEYLLDNYEGYSDFWIGANDKTKEGSFVWSNNNSPVSFTRWGYKEPDNTDQEDCVVLWETNNWAWNDEACSDKYGFICQQ